MIKVIRGKAMILYHGSKEIVKYPEIRKAQFNKDFYFGFYCTKYKNQAERWASRYGRQGYLNTYHYTPKPNNPLPPSSPSELCTWLVKMMTEARCLLCFLASILAAANHGFTSSQCCTTLGCTQTPEGLTPGLLVPTAGQSLGSMFGFSWQH